MKKFLTAIILFSLFISACNSSTDSANSESAAVTDPAPQNNASQNNTVVASDASIQMPAADNGGKLIPQGSQKPSAVAPANPGASNPNAGSTGINPAHGEPGHRCDIAVGAPLNSPPGNSTPTPTVAPSPASPPSGMQSPSFSTTPMAPLTAPPPAPSAAPSPAPTTTAPGMNPPHGQPGHDCTIAVGAPLKK